MSEPRDPSAGGAAPVPAPESVAGVTVEYRVRFDEAGPDDVVRASALLRYAQDCAWVHSESLGFGREWYSERGFTWVVRSVELRLVGRASNADRLALTTAVVGFRRVWARRRTLIRDAAGAVLATVETDFVMTHIARGLPARVPPEFPRLFGVPPGAFEPHRVALPATPATATRVAFSVRHNELDPLGHANHAAYLDWLDEAVRGMPRGDAALASLPRTYRLEYVAPALPGMKLLGAAWPREDSDGVCYRLTSADADLLRATVRGAAAAEAPST